MKISLQNCFPISGRCVATNNFYLQKRFNYFMQFDKLHIPVLAGTAVNYLNPKQSQIIIDMTFGAGGHTKKILEESKNVKVFCLDRDPVAYSYAEKLKDQYPNQVFPLLGKFSDLPKLLHPYNIKQNSIDAMLFDFGCSPMQFENKARGFSITKDGPLDMRMNQNEECPTAAQILATANETDLTKILKIYGEEKLARKITRAIIETRYTFRPIKTTNEFSNLISSVTGSEVRFDKLGRYTHAAAKSFQALRIFVNNELNEINYAMILAQKYLKIGGVMVTLSFHSLEDTIIKRHITGNVTNTVANMLPLKFYSYTAYFDKESVESFSSTPWHSINKHVITPSDYEIEINPRSRSAKLRAAIRIS